MKRSYLLLLCAGAMFVACTPKESVQHGKTVSARIDSLIRTIPDFSGVILVADHGIVQYHQAFGFRNRERQIPLDTADIFELASLSKQFTSMIIMMLQEEGKLQFDDSLSAFIKELPYHGITIRHLLTHTSGLPDYQAVMDAHWDKSKVAGNEDNIDYLIKYKPPVLFRPGDKYTYSNTGYMLLASIAEKASGEDFIELCRRKIFSRLKMNNTDIRTPEEKQSIHHFALGYIYVADQARYVAADSFPEFNYAIWLGNRKGPGRISSTSSDLLLWDRALYTEELIKKKTLDVAFEPTTLNNDSISNYGFGWNIKVDSTMGKIVSHTGDNPGYKTEIVRYIDRDRTIIFLNNNAHPKKTEMMKQIKKIVSTY